MPCCSWKQFSEELPYYFRMNKADPVLIDWDTAKKHWKRYHMTPGESAKTQVGAIVKEGEYLLLSNGRKKPPSSGSARPRPVRPVLV